MQCERHLSGNQIFSGGSESPDSRTGTKHGCQRWGVGRVTKTKTTPSVGRKLNTGRVLPRMTPYSPEEAGLGGVRPKGFSGIGTALKGSARAAAGNHVSPGSVSGAGSLSRTERPDF